MARQNKNDWYDVKENGCWECNLAPTRDGYCQKWDGKRLVPAHRYSYELLKGKIKEGMTIDHLCRNVKCVNPEHLEEVSLTENIRRASRLNYDIIKIIKDLYQQGNKQVEIAKKFGIGQDHVSRIINNISWATT